ncbi:MAG: MarR family transcriptional regulator [Candidatus Aenigmatarchaeota archaeon]
MKGIAVLPLAALLVLAVVLLPCPAAAQETYYADVMMEVSADGSVAISGLSNHPGLSAGVYDEYTSKKGSYWLLNITLPGTFSDYVYTLRMPPGSSANYIKSSGRVSIGQEGESVVIEGTGKDIGFSVAVQYTVSPGGYSGYYPLLFIPTIAIIAAVLFLFRGKLFQKGPAKKKAYDSRMLAGRQLAIVQTLEKSGKPMTQRQIEQALSLPKSSVSRNISSLVRAGILVRHERGMSNAVWFSEKAGKSEKPESRAKS